MKCPKCGKETSEFNNVHVCFNCRKFVTACHFCGEPIFPEINWGSVRDAFDRKHFLYICRKCLEEIEKGD